MQKDLLCKKLRFETTHHLIDVKHFIKEKLRAQINNQDIILVTLLLLANTYLRTRRVRFSMKVFQTFFEFFLHFPLLPAVFLTLTCLLLNFLAWSLRTGVNRLNSSTKARPAVSWDKSAMDISLDHITGMRDTLMIKVRRLQNDDFDALFACFTLWSRMSEVWHTRTQF